MANLMDGKKLSNQVKADLKVKTEELKKVYGREPHLVVVLVGENPASQSYVKAKAKACGVAGIKSTIVELSASVLEADLLALIDNLNHDNHVDGILVQLPLPKHILEQKVIDAVSYEKDVDGFHPLNAGHLFTKRPSTEPCTPRGIMRLLEAENVSISGKNAVIIGRSNIVGMPMFALLLHANATVTVCHSRTQNLAEVCRQADILVAAIGKAHFVTADMVKPGAVVIDVGINRVDGKLVGDVDFDAVSEIASAITPVPGGVGPMTIASLLENTVDLFERRLGGVGL